MNNRKLHDDLKKMFCVYVHRQDTSDELTSAAAYYGLEERAIQRYLNDALFHAKVDALVYNVILFVGNRENEDYAALSEENGRLREALGLLINFIPEGWPMPFGWNQVVAQARKAMEG